MAGYPIELTTPRGTYSTRFTIDDDRPLGLQLCHVVEELQQQDVMMAGGPGDELVVLWSDAEVDVSQSPAQLGISPFRPIQLRMQPKAVTVAPRLPRWRIVLQRPAVLVAMHAGALAALVTWSLTSSHAWSDLAVASNRRADPVTGAVMGLAIGALLFASIAVHAGESVHRKAALGALLGGLGGAIGGAASVSLSDILLARDDLSFTLARFAAWSVLGASLGATLGLDWWRADRRRVGECAAGGALAGLLGALVYQLAGPGDLAHALSFTVFGAGTGAAVVAPPLCRAVAILTLEHVAGRATSVWSVREWALTDGVIVPLNGSSRGAAGAHLVAVACAAGECRLVSPHEGAAECASFAVAGRKVPGAVALRGDDTIDIGEAVYRFHQLASQRG